MLHHVLQNEMSLYWFSQLKIIKAKSFEIVIAAAFLIILQIAITVATVALTSAITAVQEIWIFPQRIHIKYKIEGASSLASFLQVSLKLSSSPNNSWKNVPKEIHHTCLATPSKILYVN